MKSKKPSTRKHIHISDGGVFKFILEDNIKKGFWMSTTAKGFYYGKKTKEKNEKMYGQTKVVHKKNTPEPKFMEYDFVKKPKTKSGSYKKFFTVYTEGEVDITFVMQDVIKNGMLISTEMKTWYCGEPDYKHSKSMLKVKHPLKADFSSDKMKYPQ